MAFDPVADKYKQQIKKFYKESTEAIKQSILTVRDFKSGNIDLIKLSTEIEEFLKEIEKLYPLLEALAYTKSGRTAILNIYYYEIFNDVTKLVRKYVSNKATDKTVELLQDLIPRPK